MRSNFYLFVGNFIVLYIPNVDNRLQKFDKSFQDELTEEIAVRFFVFANSFSKFLFSRNDKCLQISILSENILMTCVHFFHARFIDLCTFINPSLSSILFMFLFEFFMEHLFFLLDYLRFFLFKLLESHD